MTLKIARPRTSIGTSPCFEKQRRCSDKLFLVPMWLVTAVSFTFLVFGKRGWSQDGLSLLCRSGFARFASIVVKQRQFRCGDQLFLVPMWLVTAVSFTLLRVYITVVTISEPGWLVIAASFTFGPVCKQAWA